MAQSLASRGYAVLQPNFRGSIGFGRAFLEAAYGEWGRKMQTDLSDGITHLAGRGMVDPSRVCIMGGSYGGYAALAGVTLQRDIYRCAVAIAPVSDVQEFLGWRVSRGGRENADYRYWTRYLGVDAHTDARLREISPQRAAANGTAPVLLIHGRDDTVVPYAQSTGMRNALANAGRSVQLVDLRAEDHWLSSEPTRIQTMQAAVAFIEQHNPPR
jgi:dipeptidyl aminopeptidase/acylaminoacyl peptidase